MFPNFSITQVWDQLFSLFRLISFLLALALEQAAADGAAVVGRVSSREDVDGTKKKVVFVKLLLLEVWQSCDEFNNIHVLEKRKYFER